MPEASRTVLVAGGGIAGLTAALCLAAKGFRVDLFEQADGFETVGAGLQISPNAFHVLEGLGIGRAVKTVATGPNAIRIMSARSNRQISQIPLGARAIERYGAPYLVVHRADLQQVLAGAARANPDIVLHMGKRIDDVASHANGITALAYGEGRIEEHLGAALVAADGVWSKLRSAHFGGADARFSGFLAWRGLVAADQLPGAQDLENIQLWLAPRAHAVTYPVRNGRYLNAVVVTRAADRQEPQRGWIQECDVSELAKSLVNWHPSIQALLKHRTRWTRWPLYIAPRLKAWNHGPLALIGDAAHAMLPFAAQGAAMAIEDASVLADSLAPTLDGGLPLQQALENYSAARRTRISRMKRLTQINRAIYHLPEPLGFARNLAMIALGGNRLLARQDWIYDWHPAE